MISASVDFERMVTTGAFSARFVADLIYDGDPIMFDLPMSNCELVWDGDAKVLGQGTASVDFHDDEGGSIIPELPTDVLAPYVAFLDISYRVAVGARFTEKVFLGRLKIVDAGEPRRRAFWINERRVTHGSRVSLTLADQFAVTDRERFIVPSGPSNTLSTWDEIARVTALSVVRNVPDAPILRNIVYEENRLDALMKLGEVLGGVPYMAPGGSIQIRPYEWPEPVMTLRDGPEGTVISAIPQRISWEGIYNQTVIRTDDNTSETKTILATAEVNYGPLRYGTHSGGFGRIPYFASSPAVRTVAQATDYANIQLPRVSTIPAVRWTVEAHPDPRLEVGDVVILDVDGRTMDARLVKKRLGSTMTLEVEVRR